MLRGHAPLPADAAVGSGLSASSRATRIDCARRDARGRVTHVGGADADGRRWMRELVEVVRLAQDGGVRYYVVRGFQEIGLTVEDGQLVAMTGESWSVALLPTCSG